MNSAIRIGAARLKPEASYLCDFPIWPACPYTASPSPYVNILLMADVQITIAVARVLQEFLADTAEPRYGYELMQLTGFPSGKLYPILARLQRAGWLCREREDIDPARAGRPARYLYRITPDGIETARSELAVLRTQLAPLPVPTLPRLQPEGGYA